MLLVTSYKHALYTANKTYLYLNLRAIVGGRTSARRNLTRTIPGNQAMEQQVERIYRTKATIKERTKVCTRKSRNRNRTIRLATIVYNY